MTSALGGRTLVCTSVLVRLDRACVQRLVGRTLSEMASDTQDSAEEQVRQVALDAYLYLYPLVMMDFTRRQMTWASS